MEEAAEGSAEDGYPGLYNRDDEEEEEGSGLWHSDYSDPHVEEDAGDTDIVNVDDEIDPRDLDIGFHEDITSGPDRPDSVPETTTSHTVPSKDPTLLEDPTRHFSQDTNFFAQPGIITGVYTFLYHCVHKSIHAFVTYEESLRESTSSLTTCPFLFSLFLVTSDIFPEFIYCANGLRF